VGAGPHTLATLAKLIGESEKSDNGIEKVLFPRSLAYLNTVGNLR
jgi:hypothetical protein